jgi:Cu(I)/Ag(I) efflux system membrane protein CusA/SilA
VVARSGVNTKQVIDAVKARIAKIQPGLRRMSGLSRSTTGRAIRRASDTLRRALIEEILLVTLARRLPDAPIDLDRHHSAAWRCSARSSGCTAGIVQHHEPRRYRHRHRRLVDAGIVVTENAFRYLEQRKVDPRSPARQRETVLERGWWAVPSSSRWRSFCWRLSRSLP